MPWSTFPAASSLVIDAKVSLNAYQDAFNAVDETDARKAGPRRARHLDAQSCQRAGQQGYWTSSRTRRITSSCSCRVSISSSAALEHDPGLWDYAFERRVLLATPTNLVAIARTVAAVWRQEKLAKEARQIGLLGKELYERLSVVGEHLAGAGTHLNRAVGSFNKATNSYNTRLMSTGKRFRDLNVDTGGRELDDVSGRRSAGQSRHHRQRRRACRPQEPQRRAEPSGCLAPAHPLNQINATAQRARPVQRGERRHFRGARVGSARSGRGRRGDPQCVADAARRSRASTA